MERTKILRDLNLLLLGRRICNTLDHWFLSSPTNPQPPILNSWWRSPLHLGEVYVSGLLKRLIFSVPIPTQNEHSYFRTCPYSSLTPSSYYYSTTRLVVVVVVVVVAR